MSFLLRSAAGAFTVNEGHSLEELRAGEIADFVVPMDYLLGSYEKVCLPIEMRRSVVNGMPVKPCHVGGLAVGTIVRLYVGNEFAGMGIVNEEGGITIKAMLLEIQGREI